MYEGEEPSTLALISFVFFIFGLGFGIAGFGGALNL